jgi:hypothetical protein
MLEVEVVEETILLLCLVAKAVEELAVRIQVLWQLLEQLIQAVVAVAVLPHQIMKAPTVVQAS